ncbi:MAG: cell wall-associated hydrolase, invasion-associated protein [Bacteroidetes bacterium]|nr:MAG: cell wall-associated hydrolase, invasion-associated protein [Bacteroidota bacterium]
MVSQLLFGDHFEVVEKSGSWHRIVTAWDQYDCWIDRKQYMTISKVTFDNLNNNPAPVANELVQVITDQKSGHSFPIPVGSSLPFFHGGHCQIEDRTYRYHGTAKPFAETNDRVAIVETAYLFLNSPYLWGGRSPFGIDCSGLTQIVFKVNGFRLKRDAYQQVELGAAYSFVEEAQPGDLAFFDNEEGRITHVGIVAGVNRIIHASGRVRVDHFDHYGIFTPERGGYTHNLRVIKNTFA